MDRAELERAIQRIAEIRVKWFDADQIIWQRHHRPQDDYDIAAEADELFTLTARLTERADREGRDRLYQCTTCDLLIQPVLVKRATLPCPDCKTDTAIPYTPPLAAPQEGGEG